MKLSADIYLNVSVETAADLAIVQQAVELMEAAGVKVSPRGATVAAPTLAQTSAATAAAATAPTTPAATTPAATGPTPGAVKKAAAAAAKKQAAADKKAKVAAAKKALAEAEEPDATPEPDDAPAADGVEATIDDLRLAVRAVIEAHDLETVAAVLSKHGAEDLPSVDPSLYDAILADLKAV